MILHLFSSLSSTRWTTWTWQQVYALITSEALRQHTEQYRSTQNHQIKMQMPSIIASVNFRGFDKGEGDGRTMACAQCYTGAILLDADHLTPEQVSELMGRLRLDSHALMAYPTISGQGLRIYALVDRQPANAKEFAAAWRYVNEHFSRQYGFGIDPSVKNANRMSVLCYAPDAFYHPQAVPFKMTDILAAAQPAEPQPAESEAEPKAKPRKPKKTIVHHATPEKADAVVQQELELCGLTYSPGQRHEYVLQYIFLFNRLGVYRNEAMQWCIDAFPECLKADNDVRKIIEGVYRDHTQEYGTLRPYDLRRRHNRKAEKTNASRASVDEMQAFISQRMQLRLNTITNTIEYRTAEAEPWAELSDRLVSSLWVDMQTAGINADLNHLRTLLSSDWVEQYNPIEEYFKSLPPPDGTDYIAQMAARVRCSDASPDEFAFYFRKWFVATVAGALSPDVVNHFILIFIGAQGIYKSTFFERLLPPELRQYQCVKTNSSRLDKDDRISITENILMGLEEIDTMSAAEYNQLKALITVGYIKERMPYGRIKVRRPHIASFYATGNNQQFISDYTGTRRMGPFTIESIASPYAQPVPYAQLYAQAYQLAQPQSGYEYWFSSDEIRQLEHRNRAYTITNEAMELVLKYFRKPRENEKARLMTVSEIAIRFGVTVRLNTIRIGKALRELGFKNIRTNHGSFWLIIDRSAEETNGILPEEVIEAEEP